MRKILTTHRFERRLVSFVKSHPDLSRGVKMTMKNIATDPFDRHLKTHKLSGPLKECFASSVTYGYRIIFIMDDDSICFLDIGSHDEVY